jgi:sugar/nucleoside kinase (ribokinase family)
MTALTFGEALVGYASVEDNLRIATQFVRFPGGAELNVAVGLTRLGVNTTWASVIEEDAHGDYLADTVAQLGIRPLIGLAEGSLLTGASEPYDIAQFCLRRGISELVIKLGAKGAHGWTAGGEVAQSRTFTVTPVDTVGAGDGFAAGYLAGLLTGAHLQQRLDQAAALGALVTTRRGDLAAMPSRTEADELLTQPSVPA